MLAGLMLLIILAMKLFPTLPVSRMLHVALVEAPLRQLAAMGRRHLIYAAVLVGLVFAGSEVILLLGSADMVMLLAWDVSLYIDAVIATWTLSIVARGKASWQTLGTGVAECWHRVSRPRAPRRRREGSRAANDTDDDERAWVYALAA